MEYRPSPSPRPERARFLSIVDRVVGWIVEGALLAAGGIVPLFFLSWTMDPLEVNKQMLLAACAGVALLGWLAQQALRASFSVGYSLPLSLGGAVLTIFFGLSFTSVDRFLSFVGAPGQVTWAWTTLAASMALLFVAAQTWGRPQLWRWFIAVWVSGGVVSALGLLRLLGWGPSFGAQTFTTVGTYNAAAVFLAGPFLALTWQLWNGKEVFAGALGIQEKNAGRFQVFLAIVWIVTLAFLIAVNDRPVWALILLAIAAMKGAVYLQTAKIPLSPRLLFMALTGVSAAVFLFVRSPLSGSLPTEVSLSPALSWQIVRSVADERLFQGSGPGTWAYEYSRFRPAAVNLTPFWSVRFDRASNAWFTLLGTSGILGTATWGAFLVLTFWYGVARLRQLKEEGDRTLLSYFLVIFGSSVLSQFFYNISISQLVLIVGAAGGIASWGQVRVFTRFQEAKPRLALFAPLLLVVVGGVAVGWWVLGRGLRAQVAFAKGMNAAQATDYNQAIPALEEASRRSLGGDMYDRNASQAYLLRMVQEMKGGMTAERSRNVTVATERAVSLAREATQKAPENVENWSNFALILQTISAYSRGADEQAIAMYQEALKREPNNPYFEYQIGRLRIARADGYRQLLQSKESAVRQDAERNMKEEFDQAATAFNAAIQMKPDFAPAHYSLGLVYERQGRLSDAIEKVEHALSANTKDVGIAFQLAMLYYRHKEVDKATRLLEQVVMVDPNYANARWYLSAAYESQGRYKEALDQANAVLRTNPDNVTVKARVEKLVKMRDNVKPAGTAALPEPIDTIQP